MSLTLCWIHLGFWHWIQEHLCLWPFISWEYQCIRVQFLLQDAPLSVPFSDLLLHKENFLQDSPCFVDGCIVWAIWTSGLDTHIQCDLGHSFHILAVLGYAAARTATWYCQQFTRNQQWLEAIWVNTHWTALGKLTKEPFWDSQDGSPVLLLCLPGDTSYSPGHEELPVYTQSCRLTEVKQPLETAAYLSGDPVPL